ncbi:helix-turn-helix transcriptional regulator [Carbonactinospora thermoautotrophica]|uniref:helix-turn-helix transcriptional regulator n=1 Tax=Carbonactinospora thermoautotrophica TaxID=1469144 RepID=UPI00226F977B|nr:helix-turn-helix transcriptional regulator [Carbonactinospora thermoautotrophica]
MTAWTGLRRWREERNLTQERLAALIRERATELGVNLGCDFKRVGKWERGEVAWPSAEYRRVLESVTGLTCEELGFRPPWRETGQDTGRETWPRAAEEWGQGDTKGSFTPLALIHAHSPTVTESCGQDEEDPVERRTLLAGVAGLALTGVTVDPAAATAPRTVTTADVAVIRDMLRAIKGSDHQLGGGYARETAVHYLNQVIIPRLHARADEEVRRELFSAATEFAACVAWMHQDVGRHHEARQLFGQAFSWAQETGDHVLAAWVLSLRGLQEVWIGDAEQALGFTSGAVGLSYRATPIARAFILGKHARALALTGDKAETQRVLGQVRDSYEQAGARTEPTWTSSYGWAYLRDEEAHCYRELGLGAEAVEAATESLKTRGEDQYARSRSFCTGVLAMGLVQVGEVEQACAVGHQLVGMVERLASCRTQERLREVLKELSPYTAEPAVRDLAEAARPVLVHPI